MALVKSKRPQSKFYLTGNPFVLPPKVQRLEAETKAVEIRHIVTKCLLVDFCVNESTIKYIMGKSKLKHKKREEGEDFQYPELTEAEKWLIEEERKAILTILRSLHQNIIMANSIFAEHDVEFYERRRRQDIAIGNCYQLLQEFQYVIDCLPYVNINKYEDVTKEIRAEISLLKGWRGSDRTRYNKVRESRGEPPLGPTRNPSKKKKRIRLRAVRPAAFPDKSTGCA